MGGLYTDALGDFNAVLSVHPHNTLALRNRAETERQLGQIDEAVRDLDVVLAVRLDDGRPLESR